MRQFKLFVATCFFLVGMAVVAFAQNWQNVNTNVGSGWTTTSGTITTDSLKVRHVNATPDADTTGIYTGLQWFDRVSTYFRLVTGESGADSIAYRIVCEVSNDGTLWSRVDSTGTINPATDALNAYANVKEFNHFFASRVRFIVLSETGAAMATGDTLRGQLLVHWHQ